jgi:hypothetical protein
MSTTLITLQQNASDAAAAAATAARDSLKTADLYHQQQIGAEYNEAVAVTVLLPYFAADGGPD